MNLYAARLIPHLNPAPMPDALANRLLAQIAQELSSPDLVFPTSFDLTLRVQNLLKRPETGIDQIAALVATEPLLSSKIMAYANSTAVRGSGPEITELRTAVMRIGLDAVRSVSYTVAVEQLVRSKHMAPYMDVSRLMWEHSLMVAVLGRRLAREYRLNPEKAFFLGVIHDLGGFYLLYRCSADAELARDREQLLDLVFDWHDGIGHALLSALGVQEELVTAVQDHESDASGLTGVRNWTELLLVADQLVQTAIDWATPEQRARRGGKLPETLLDTAARDELMAQAREDRASLTAMG